LPSSPDNRAIILGVDPGSLRTGWGVVERRGARLASLGAGVIAADSNALLSERLVVIHAALRAVIERFQPTSMAVEDVFSKHARSALKLGHARGVILLCGAQGGLPVSAYPPAVIKRSIAGRGAASKEQLGRILAAMLELPEPPSLDASDALAVAVTHANATRVLRDKDART
jgi:crossover junction endodeoxyribonuclease RuvC